MHQIWQRLKMKRRLPFPGWHTLFLFVSTLGLGMLVASSAASAAEAVAGQQPMSRPIAQIFTFLFLMLGPFKIIAPFSRITKGTDAKFTRQIAMRATLFASLALLLAAFLGEKILSNFGIPLPVLALSVGIILFLVALKTVLEQFAPPHSEEIAGQALTPTMSMAMTPLAFPTIVTPYGIGALVVFLALSPDLNTQLTIGAIVLVIMLLNLTVMMLTPHIRPLMGAALAILGAVLGIIQVALGLQIIHTSLKALGIL
jgi:multiple antibiotic resistance protein